MPKDLLQAAWFPCASSQENAQDPNEKMLLGDEGVWLKVSEGVWSGTKNFVCLYPAVVTKSFLFCPVGATATFKTAHIVLHMLLHSL